MRRYERQVGARRLQGGYMRNPVDGAATGVGVAQAHDAIERGGREEYRHRRQMALLEGEQRSALAASGVVVDSGSSLELQDASMREGEYDAATIRFNSARERWGHQVQAVQYRNEASAARAAGRNALFGSLIGAGTGLMSSGMFTPAPAKPFNFKPFEPSYTYNDWRRSR